MTNLSKSDLELELIMAAREYGISTTLFRNAIGEKLGVNVTDMECLALVFFKGLATPTELSRYTGLSSGATTAMLDRLEKAELIERQPNPKDRRGTLIAVNRNSIHTVGPLFATTRKAQNQLVSEYTADELELIAGFLRRFTDVWEVGRKELKAHIK